MTKPTEIYPITQYAVSPPLTLTGRSFSWDSALTGPLTWTDGSTASTAWTFANTGTNTTMTASSALMAFSHTVQAEQLTSTDDITMLGHLFTVGSNDPIDIVFKFLGPFGGFSTLTGSQSQLEYSNLFKAPDIHVGSSLIAFGTSQLVGAVTIGEGEYDLPAVTGTIGYLVIQTSTGTPDQWGYTTPTPASGNWGFWNMTGTTLTTIDVDADVELGGDLDVASTINDLIIKAIGTNNIIIGNADTLSSLDTGDENFAFGPGAGENLNTGRFNVLMGTNAGNMITDATSNMLIGFGAGSLLDSTSNVGVGHNALSRNIGNGANVAIGKSALQGSVGSEAVQTTAVGFEAGVLIGNSTGGTYIGYKAGEGVTTGPFNTFIGYRAGDSTTTGRECIVIGRGYDTSAAGADHELNIGGVLVGFNASHATPGLNVVGFLTAGDGTNELQVSATGDLSFAGTGGLLYGNMDQENATSFTVTLTSQNDWYELDHATTGIVAGELNDVTFDGDHYLEVNTAGMYFIIYSLVCSINDTNQHIEFQILKNGNVTGKGESHTTFIASSRDLPCGSNTILDLAVDDEISIGARNVTVAGKIITIDHLEMTIFMVGGT